MEVTKFEGTVSLEQKDRELLEALLTHLERLVDAQGKNTVHMDTAAITAATRKVAEKVVAEAAEVVKQDTPAPVTIEPEKPKPAPVRTVTQEQLQTLVVQLCGTDKKALTAAIVKSYAPKVSAIPEDKRAEVYDKLLELVGDDED